MMIIISDTIAVRRPGTVYEFKRDIAKIISYNYYFACMESSCAHFDLSMASCFICPIMDPYNYISI